MALRASVASRLRGSKVVSKARGRIPAGIHPPRARGCWVPYCSPAALGWDCLLGRGRGDSWRSPRPLWRKEIRRPRPSWLRGFVVSCLPGWRKTRRRSKEGPSRRLSVGKESRATAILTVVIRNSQLPLASLPSRIPAFRPASTPGLGGATKNRVRFSFTLSSNPVHIASAPTFQPVSRTGEPRLLRKNQRDRRFFTARWLGFCAAEPGCQENSTGTLKNKLLDAVTQRRTPPTTG